MRLNAPELAYGFNMRNIQGLSLLEGTGTRTQIEKQLNQVLQNLPAGIYILQLNHSGQRYEAKLVKP
ncbi:MAG: T9SS type A sorting domain-containing protein [Microscillaceae bacterium]|nr:T9SS type A sorting domain-containing protein [Microscillaceae bacterium]